MFKNSTYCKEMLVQLPDSVSQHLIGAVTMPLSTATTLLRYYVNTISEVNHI